MDLNDLSISSKRWLGLAALLLLAGSAPFVALRLARLMLQPEVLLLWLAAEVLWFLLWFRPTYQQLDRIPEPCAPDNFTADDGKRNWDKFLRLTKALGGVDPEPYLRQWFCNAEFDSIKRGNVAEMLTYGFLYRHRHEMTGELASFPDEMVDGLQEVMGVEFPAGYTPGLRFMSHLWEPLRAHFRPLALYCGMEVLHRAQLLVMASYGFQHKHLGLLSYYTLNCGRDCPPIPPCQPSSDNDDEWTPFAAAGPAAVGPDGCSGSAAGPANPLDDAVPSGASASTPVLFLHGVGGLMLYLEMLKHVIGLGHPVLVVEMKHVAMRVSSYIPSVDEVTEGIVRILDHEGIGAVCVVGHSYGSFAASRLNSLHRARLHSLCLIDPVCLGMFMPALLHNFMYRRPRIDWRHPDVLVRDLALFFASRDVHIAATFARRFYWSQLNLWPGDMPRGSCVVLSGNDDLCHAEEVKRMLDQAGHVKVILNPHLFHGAFLLDPTTKASLMAEVAALLATSGSIVARLAAPVVDRTLSAAYSLMQEVDSLRARLSVHLPAEQGGRSLRRTLTDLPGRTWQHVSSLAAPHPVRRNATSFTSQRASGPSTADHSGNTSSSARALSRFRPQEQQQEQQQQQEEQKEQQEQGQLLCSSRGGGSRGLLQGALGASPESPGQQQQQQQQHPGSQQLQPGDATAPAAGAWGTHPGAAAGGESTTSSARVHHKNLSTIPSMDGAMLQAASAGAGPGGAADGPCQPQLPCSTTGQAQAPAATAANGTDSKNGLRHRLGLAFRRTLSR